MAVGSVSEASDFEDNMTDIMYRIEGIEHFSIENFYTFDYMNSDENLVDSSLTDLLNQWYTTFVGYNDILLSQLVKSQLIIAQAQEENSKIELNKWVS